MSGTVFIKSLLQLRLFASREEKQRLNRNDQVSTYVHTVEQSCLQGVIGNLGTLKTTGSCTVAVAEENTLDFCIPPGCSCRQEMIRDQTRSSVSPASEYSVLTSVLRAKICRKVLWLR